MTPDISPVAPRSGDAMERTTLRDAAIYAKTTLEYLRDNPDDHDCGTVPMRAILGLDAALNALPAAPPSPGLTALEIVAALVEVVRARASAWERSAERAIDDLEKTVRLDRARSAAEIADLIEREAARLLAAKGEART